MDSSSGKPWKGEYGCVKAESAEEFMKRTRPDLHRPDTDTWLLPQDFYPIYSGQVGVRGEVLERIIFDEVDVRNAAAVDWWLAKIRGAHDAIDYLCLNAQTELGGTATSTTVEDMLADAELTGTMTYDEIMKRWPNRQAGASRASLLPEFEIGVKYLLSKLVSKFGSKTVKTRTEIQFVSSVAGNTVVAFDANGKISKSFADGSSGWFEYSGAKIKGDQLKQLMISQDYRFNSIAPTIFNTGVNLNWLGFYLKYFAQEAMSPYHAISADPETGKFFYELTASTLHDAYTTVLNLGDAQVGSFVGGATYGALQYLGVYMKDRTKPPLQRRTVFLDNPAVYVAGKMIESPFGPSSAVLEENGLCYDYRNAAQSVGYLEGWKIFNPASGIAEYWSVPSLAYLTGSE